MEAPEPEVCVRQSLPIGGHKCGEGVAQTQGQRKKLSRGTRCKACWEGQSLLTRGGLQRPDKEVLKR